jgi:hypothetical protein
MPSLGNQRDVNTEIKKRKNKDSDPYIKGLQSDVNSLEEKPEWILKRIEGNLIDINNNLKEIIRLLQEKN